MNSLIIQPNRFNGSLSIKKRTQQPNTNSSFNIFSQISIKKKIDSKKVENSQSRKKIDMFYSHMSKKSSYPQEQSPIINPFIIKRTNSETIEQNAQTENLKQFQQQKPINQSTGWGHSLIKFIINRSKNRSIQHQINIIPSDTILHKKVPQKSQDQNSQTLKQTQEALVSGKKLNEMYYKIKEQFKNLEKIKKKPEQYHHYKSGGAKSSKSLLNRSTQNQCQARDQSLNSQKNPTRITRSSSQIRQKPHRMNTQPSSMITVSGVISYKFKSVKAQTSLIYNHLQNKSSQQLLTSQLQSIKDRLKCASSRGNKIEYRSVGKKMKQTKQKEIAFREELTKKELKDLSTTEYLKHVMDQKGKIDKVYGEEGSSLQYISYLMNQISLDRPLAQQSVEFIDQKIREQLNVRNYQTTHSQTEPHKTNHYINYSINNDDILLSHRKKLVYKPKGSRKKLHYPQSINQQLTDRSGVMLNSLTFLNEY